MSHDTSRCVLPDNVAQSLTGDASGPIGTERSVWSGQCGSFFWYLVLSHGEAFSVSLMAVLSLQFLADLLWLFRRFHLAWIDWLGRHFWSGRIVVSVSVHYADSREFCQLSSICQDDFSVRTNVRTFPVSRGCLINDSPTWVRFLQHRGLRIISSPTFFPIPSACRGLLCFSVWLLLLSVLPSFILLLFFYFHSDA